MLPSSGRTSLPPASMYGRGLGHMPEGPPAAVTSEAPMTDDDQVPDRRWQVGSISRTRGPIIVAAISGVNFPRDDVMDQPPCNTCPGSIRQPDECKYPHNSTVQGIGTFGITQLSYFRPYSLPLRHLLPTVANLIVGGPFGHSRPEGTNFFLSRSPVGLPFLCR